MIATVTTTIHTVEIVVERTYSGSADQKLESCSGTVADR